MKVIALVDPHSGGHHTSFMRQFSKILIDLGYKVIALHQETADDLVSWIEKHSDPQALICEELHLKKTTTILLDKYRNTQIVFHYWQQVSRLLGRIEKQQEIKVDHVFFAWLDTFLANYLHPKLVNLVFPYPWSGLYFHPRHLRLSDGLSHKAGISSIDVILNSKNCQGVATHDAGITDIMGDRYPGKNIVFFPETADDSPPLANYPLASEIRNKADGRIVVGMIGLSKQQGLMTFLRLAKIAPSDQYFFLFAGRFNPRDMNDREVKEWESFLRDSRENCFYHLQNIPEGKEYNSVFCAMDVPFLVYNNFTSTSNRLTKAAIFEKPVLSTNRFVLGKDVIRYQLGVAVEEGNESACLDGLDTLSGNWLRKGFDKKNFEEYARKNSSEELMKSFRQLLTPSN